MTSKAGQGSGSGASKGASQFGSGATKDADVLQLEHALRGYKAHFTRTVNANKRLVDFAPTVPTQSTVESLQKGLQKLDEQYEKLTQVILELQDTCTEEGHEEYETYLDELLGRYEENKFNILDAIKATGLQPREPLTRATRRSRRTGSPDDDNTDVKLHLNKSLKPFSLLSTHNPTEFRSWVKQFRAYWRTSNMESLEVADQQIYLENCVEPVLYSRIETYVTDTTPIFGADDCCVGLLMKDFEERWPLYTRRLEFFRSSQDVGQEVSTWVCKLKQLAEECELEDLSQDDLLMFRIVAGMKARDIRN